MSTALFLISSLSISFFYCSININNSLLPCSLTSEDVIMVYTFPNCIRVKWTQIVIGRIWNVYMDSMFLALNRQLASHVILNSIQRYIIYNLYKDLKKTIALWNFYKNNQKLNWIIISPRNNNFEQTIYFTND